MRKSAHVLWSLALLVAFILGGIAAHLIARRHHWHPHYGDIPTWATAIITLAAAAFALGQLAILGRSQRQANDIAVRSQAEEILVRTSQAEPDTLVVENRSGRPIRSVDARLLNENGTIMAEADKLPELATARVDGARYERKDNTQKLLRVLEVQHKVRFDFGVAGIDRFKFLMRFTDDADVEWEVDEELHLKQASRHPRW